MRDHRFDRYIYMGMTAILVILAATLVIFGFLERASVASAGKKILTVLAPVIYGAVLTFLLCPVYNLGGACTRHFLGTRVKNGRLLHVAERIIGTVLSLVFLWAVISSLLQLVIPQIYTSIIGIVNMMPVYVQNIQRWIEDIFANNQNLEQMALSYYQQAVAYFQSWAGENLIPSLQNFQNPESWKGLEKIVGGVSSGVMGVYNLAKNLLIGLIVMIYLLNIKDTLTAQSKKMIYAFLPLRYANATVDEFRYIHRVFSGFIIGKLIDSLIIGVLCFVLMSICKMPFELLISVIIGVTNIVPFFGPFIGAIPSAVLVFLISPLQCVYFILLILALQQFDGNILGPKILGNSTGLSSFWVLFSILLFGGLFGFGGMIVAVPLMAVIFDLFSKCQYHFLRKKKLSPDTRDYMELLRIDEKTGNYISHE
ncbi:MAG: AI-2E family transporter [Lachnospiraceae bacterium]|nr:AI-2E family transporter [Lachnospiraceae bacterium]